jgi:membrane protein
MIPLLKQTWTDFQKHNDQWLAAALAYFTLFAIAPLAIVVSRFLGLFFQGHQDVQAQLMSYLSRHAAAGAGALRQIVASTSTQPHQGALAQVAGWIALALAALGLFGALQFALNTVWELAGRKLTIWQIVGRRISSFVVMLAVAILLGISMLVNAGLTVADSYLVSLFMGGAIVAKVLDFAVSFAVIWAAFIVLFEYLPDCRVAWRDVRAGAAMASVLFVIGQFLLGWYLGRTGMSSSYGAFGSLVVLIVWVNYSTQIMLFGAEFTHVYARRHGSQAQESSAQAQPGTRRPTKAYGG